MPKNVTIDLLDSDDSDDDEFSPETATASSTSSSLKRQAGSQPRRSKRIRSVAAQAAVVDESTTHNIDDDDTVLLDSSSDEEEDDELNGSLFARLDKRRGGPRKRSVPMKSTGLLDSDEDEEEKKEEYEILPTVSTSPSSSTSSTTSRITTTATKKRSSKAPTKKTVGMSAETYLKNLRASVKKRTFPLSQILKQETIATGRTIKPQKAWKGHWPALREFLQNTIDHLGLMDGKTGRRQACVDLHVHKPTGVSTTATQELATFVFSCKDQDICKITAWKDELIIEQLYTFPIASRALDTGVPDETKTSSSASSSNNQAGGFGDGFKTAAVALIANTKKDESTSLKWTFFAMKEQTKVEWTFQGKVREKVATFAKCQVLEVDIQKSRMNDDDRKKAEEFTNLNTDKNSNGEGYVMRQVIQGKQIGKAFIEQVVPKLVVFWDLNEESLLSMGNQVRGGGGDFIGPTSSQPNLFDGQLGNLKPQSGVYVRGIWVRPSKMKDTLMCFFSNRLEVIGRDRNEVDDDELVDAVVYVLRRCDDLPYLKELLVPLLRNGSKNQNGSKSSWLLQSPRFFNRVVEIEKDFILEVLGIPRGAIFVSSKTTNSKDPFISWAAQFLRKNGAPLVPIEKGANRYLFEEVNEFEMTERCVEILKNLLREKSRGGKDKNGGNIQSFFVSYLHSWELGMPKSFSPDVSVAFVHNAEIYIQTSLSRTLVVKVLNVCNSYLEGANAENYSSLMQAIFEILPARATKDLQLTDATSIVNRAKEVTKETKNFLSAPTVATSERATMPTETENNNNNVVMIDSEDEDVVTIEKEASQKSKQGRKKRGDSAMVPTTINDLEDEIGRLSQIAEGQSDERLIPQAEFQELSDSHDDCLRPHSDLKNVSINESLGGGHMYCDEKSASELLSGKWSTSKKKKIFALRQILAQASSIVQDSVPTLQPLLKRVSPGYDGENDTYEAFCDGKRIIINFYAFLPKIQQLSLNAPYPDQIVHDFVVVITHELAHYIKPTAGHGPIWRDAHMKMMIEVMNHLKHS